MFLGSTELLDKNPKTVSIYGLSYECQYYLISIVIVSSALLHILFMKLGKKTMLLEIS
jgi:hypothetical protein